MAPVIFVAHFLEEAPGFVSWFNSRVVPGITPEAFWTVNLTALAVTTAVLALEWASESPLSATLVVAFYAAA